MYYSELVKKHVKFHLKHIKTTRIRGDILTYIIRFIWQVNLMMKIRYALPFFTT